MNRGAFASFAVLTGVSATFDDDSFETRLKKDSISCLQIHACEKLEGVFSQDGIDLPGGFRMVRNKTTKKAAPGDILKAISVSERQAMLEDFIYERVNGFFEGRTLGWNMAAAVEQIAPTAKHVFKNLPQNVRERMAAFLQRRGKKKKWFFPMIAAVKTTFFTWVKVAFVGVAFLAKKAFAMSVTVATFLALRKHNTNHTAVPHYAPPINRQPIQHDGYDTHDLHPSPGHHLAYSSRKHCLG